MVSQGQCPTYHSLKQPAKEVPCPLAKEVQLPPAAIKAQGAPVPKAVGKAKGSNNLSASTSKAKTAYKGKENKSMEQFNALVRKLSMVIQKIPEEQMMIDLE
ncbi:hypothetical protein CROQUDRAFT_100192 [Cronartium quercuum f. sp. fusiforme G11]|uniref:Uncharacterized protein n=1 Tax=Cronartium quercuum f. sp. fusiforme G11 TaxID=708437 RepID=A0A9P6NAN9_9BASI|nr:hypothetical protein CROQUDRAFT_100192 [Cronartium quercuum f. sp. fusiforme G11]